MTRTNTLKRMVSDFPLDVVINVKDAPYSAVGDGVTDDKAAIQAAIDAGNTGGIPVFLPKGNFLVSGALTYYSSSHIFGAGQAVSTILGNNLTVPIFKTTNQSTTRYYYSIFRDFGIDNQSALNVGAIGIDLRNVSLARIDNLFFQDIEMAIQLHADAGLGAYYNVIQNTIHSTGTYFVYVSGGANENVILSCRSNVVDFPITISDSNGLKVHLCSFEVFTSGIRLSAVTEFCNVQGNRLENLGGVGTGILVEATAGWNWIGGQCFSGLATNINNSSTTSVIIDPAQTPLMAIPSFTVAGVPSASAYPRSLIYVSNEAGGATIAFSDGTNWRRVQDLAVVS